jgi:hypothetical protein
VLLEDGSTIVVAGTGSSGTRSAPASTVPGGAGDVVPTRRLGAPVVVVRRCRPAALIAAGGGAAFGGRAVGGRAVGGGAVGGGAVGGGVVGGGSVVGGSVVGGSVVGGSVVGSGGVGVVCAAAVEKVSTVVPITAAASTTKPPSRWRFGERVALASVRDTGPPGRARTSTTGSPPTWCRRLHYRPRLERSSGGSRSPRVSSGRVWRASIHATISSLLLAPERCGRGDLRS